MLESTLPLCLLLPHHDCWTYCDFIDLYPNVQARSIFTLHLTILVTSRTSRGFTDASSALSPVYCAAWPHWSWVNNDMDNVTQPVHMFWNHKLQTPTRHRQEHVVAMGIGVNKSFRRVGKSIFPFGLHVPHTHTATFCTAIVSTTVVVASIINLIAGPLNVILYIIIYILVMCF